MSALELRALLWPALGTNGSPNPRPLTLDGFARAGAGVFTAMSDDRGAARPGYFRLARNGRDQWTAELRGALATDSAYARAVLDEVRRWTDRVDVDSPGAGIAIIHPNVGGVPVVVGMAPERGADGRVVALFGVAYARSVALRTHVGHVLHGVSLLPAPGRERSDSTRSDSTPRSASAQAPSDGTRVDNSALAVRLRYATGLRDAVSPAAADDAVWRSGFVATRAIEGRDGGSRWRWPCRSASAAATWRRQRR